MKRYYAPEYDRVVDESVPRKQYEWFKRQSWFHSSYEQFYRKISRKCRFWVMMND